jgi:hypothetical protein
MKEREEKTSPLSAARSIALTISHLAAAESYLPVALGLSSFGIIELHRGGSPQIEFPALQNFFRFLVQFLSRTITVVAHSC